MPQTYVNVYDQVGEREDLIDVITSISPEDTVFLSWAGRTVASSFKHDWLTDALAASNSGNAVVDGASAAFASSDYAVRTLVTNYTQILRNPFSVSHSQEAIKQAGLTSEFDYQREKKTKENAIDLNAALINQASASGASGTARTMNGALAAITTNIRNGENAALDAPLLNRLLRDIWVQGGKPKTIFTGGVQKGVISSFTQPAGQRWVDANGKVIVQAVDKYDSDYGMLSVLLEREMPAAQIMAMEQRHWRVAYLRTLEFRELGEDGGKRRGRVETEATLEYLAQNSSGKIVNLASAGQ